MEQVVPVVLAVPAVGLVGAAQQAVVVALVVPAALVHPVLLARLPARAPLGALAVQVEQVEQVVPAVPVAGPL